MYDLIGWPQAAAVAVLLQRAGEDLHSARNTRALLKQGAREAGRHFYPVVAIAHLGWIAAIFLLIPADAEVNVFLALVYLMLQGVRYWVIATLGAFWTHRIYTLDDAPMETGGPYRFMRHPNYAVTIAETALLPLVFGAVWVSLIMTAIWIAVIRYKIVIEDAALSSRRDPVEGT